MFSELYQQLMAYQAGDDYPFHMPGHKRNEEMCPFTNPIGIDITEIDDFDNLYESAEVLLREEERAARLYGARQTFFLVNGSTVGILTAIKTVCQRGDDILVARNCHKSVYHAIELDGLNPVYIYPSASAGHGILEGISASMVEKAFCEHPSIKALMLTSPTYDGVVSDIGKISEIVHAHGAVLIVDEAHGAHFGCHPYFPKSAVTSGADVVIQSLHKTLPAMTQTGLLHLCSDRVDKKALLKNLSYYQTSSPSYVFMASIANCITLLAEKKEELFEHYMCRLRGFREQMKTLSHIHLLEIEDLDRETVFDYDLGKLVLMVTQTPWNGPQLYHCLRQEFGLQMEMVQAGYVLAMTSICDTEDGFRRLFGALKSCDERMDQEIREGGWQQSSSEQAYSGGPSGLVEPEMNLYEATQQQVASCSLSESIGKISGTTLYLYPPGIPILRESRFWHRENVSLHGIQNSSVLINRQDCL